MDTRMTPPTKEKGYTVESVDPRWVTAERTPELLWPNCIDIYDRMRRTDSRCRSVLQAVKLPIRRAKWYIDGNGADAAVTEFVASNLGLPLKGESERPDDRNRERFSFDDHLRLALTELDFGHSFFEQVYRIDPDGRARLRRLGWRPPRTIQQVKVAPDGGLISIVQAGMVATYGMALQPSAQWEPGEIPVSQLVAYVHDREGGNWLGESVLRTAYKFWMLKDRALRVQSQTIERNGMGVPIFTEPPVPEAYLQDAEGAAAWSQQQRDMGLELATGLRSGETAGGSIPEGSKLEMKGVTGTLPNATEAIRYYDDQISASVLADFLKLGGADSTGSYALGESFMNFFVMSLQSTALHIADVINQHVVNDLVDINFGMTVRAPRVGFEEIGSHQYATAGGIAQLVACGALLPEPNLENFLRDMFGIPDRDPNWKPVPNSQATASNLADSLRDAGALPED